MIPYVPPTCFGYYNGNLLATYHSLHPLISDLILVYGDLLAQGDIIIKNKANDIIYILKKRPQAVDSNPSNMWASTGIMFGV